MKRNIEKTRRLLRHLARRIVRGYAVAALVAGGFVGAASALEDSADDSDDGDGEAEVTRMRAAVHKATLQVLATPHTKDSERALIVLMAANEALAVAGVEAPTESHVQDMLVSAAVAADPIG